EDDAVDVSVEVEQRTAGVARLDVAAHGDDLTGDLTVLVDVRTAGIFNYPHRSKRVRPVVRVSGDDLWRTRTGRVSVESEWLSSQSVDGKHSDVDVRV